MITAFSDLPNSVIYPAFCIIFIGFFKDTPAIEDLLPAQQK